MTEYTPTTDQVREAWGYKQLWEGPTESTDSEFDRWLAAHDKEVLAEAGERAYEWYLRAGSTLFANLTQEDVACDLARFVRGEVE